VLPLSADHAGLLSDEDWATVAIVSLVTTVRDAAEPPATITLAPGAKCARCWRVLEEVGTQAAHPALCLRCTDAVESGLVCRSV
jgi:isoleucyl-tRNA synthetase